MPYTKAELTEMLTIDGYPRSATYDPEWVLENQMGPNVLWLTEALTQAMNLEPGMRVLDMGCGRAGLPEHLEPYWEWEFGSFHSPEWWRRHWEKTGHVSVERADMIPKGWQQWMKWMSLLFERDGQDYARQEAEMLRLDAGRNLGFTRLVACRKSAN